MQIAVVGCAEYDHIRIRRRAAVDHRGRFGMQRIAHGITYGRCRVTVLVEQVLAACPADDLVDARLGGRAGQAEVCVGKRAGIRRRERIVCGGQVATRVVGVQVAKRGVRQLPCRTAEKNGGTIRSPGRPETLRGVLEEAGDGIDGGGAVGVGNNPVD